MSRVYKSPSIVSGMSVDDIMQMDIQTFNSIPLSDMRKIVSRLASAGNKRLQNFEKQGVSSPASRYVEASGGKFSVKEKDLNQLRNEYVRARDFLQSKTGSVTGWKKVQKETQKSLADRGVNVTTGTMNRMWMTYKKLSQLDPSVKTQGMKYGALKEIANMVEDNPDLDPEEIAVRIENRIAEIYEAQQEETGGEEYTEV